MGLGPSLSIRHSQQLVLTPQLTQAIKLLQLSNLELDAFIAEELSKNPLLESQSGDDEAEAPAAAGANDEADSGEPADDPGADDLISGQADDDRPLDVDWTSEALETDSFSDVVISTGFNIPPARLPSICKTSFTDSPATSAISQGRSPKPWTRPAT